MGRFLVWPDFLLSFVGAKGGRLLRGDTVVSRRGSDFPFPVVTSTALSVLLTLVSGSSRRSVAESPYCRHLQP